MTQARYLSNHYHSTAFLPEDLNSRILSSMLEDLAGFRDAKIFSRDAGKGVVDKSARVAKTNRLRPEILADFKAAITKALPSIAPAVGLQMRDDFTFEISAAMHQDGGFFGRHIDTRTGPSGDTVRYMSAVYYLSRAPQQFSGGQFRLHALVGDAHKDIEAANNTLVVFPSFAPHEVLPISVPSGLPEDGRFSINCWVRIPHPNA